MLKRNTDDVLQKSLTSLKYKKYSPAKYALLLYLVFSIRSVDIMYDSVTNISKRQYITEFDFLPRTWIF